MRTRLVMLAGLVGLVFAEAHAAEKSKFFNAAKAECAKLHPQEYTKQKECIDDYEFVHLWTEKAALLAPNGDIDRAAVQRRRAAKDPKAIILGNCLGKAVDRSAIWDNQWDFLQYCIKDEQEAYEAIYGKLFP